MGIVTQPRLVDENPAMDAYGTWLHLMQQKTYVLTPK